MASASPLTDLGLPEIVARFADQENGLIVFSREDTTEVSSLAIALAR
jgi:hypothetical protein